MKRKGALVLFKPVKKRRIIIITAVSVLALAAVVLGIFFLLSRSGDAVKVVEVIDVGMDSYWGDESQTEGLVRTDKMQSVYMSETQIVKEVFVKEGQQVKAGDDLVSFDTTLSELEIQRQKISVSKLEESLKNAQKELAEIKTYKPYSPSAAPSAPKKQELEPVSLPYKMGGSGTQSDPYVYLWNDDCWVNDDFINKILPKHQVIVVPSDPEIPPDEPEEPTDESIEAESAEEPEPEPDIQPDPVEPEYSKSSVYVVFQVRDYDNPKGELQRYWGMNFVRKTDGSYRFSVYEPEVNDNSTDDGGGYYDDSSSGYTASQIAQMRADKEKEIKDTALQIKVERVKYQKMELEFNTGVIKADVDGVVKTVSDADTAQAEGSPLIVVSGGGGYYINGSLSELELDTVTVGQTVRVSSWMSGTETEGEITEISDYPTTDGYSSSDGNRNVSYYPFTVFVNEDAALQEDEYVSIAYSHGDVSGGVYLEIPFVLKENSKSYVYVANEKDRLEKREIVTGKTVWNSYIEVKSGITPEDHIAFPYGKNVKDGAKVEYTTPDKLYESF